LTPLKDLGCYQTSSKEGVMTTAMSLSNLFIAYVALVAAVVAITLARTLSARATCSSAQ